MLAEKGYFQSLRAERPPSLLRGIDRMCQFAADAGYRVDPDAVHKFWDIFENDYSDAERQECIDVYLETMVRYKSRENREILDRAKGIVLSS